MGSFGRKLKSIGARPCAGCPTIINGPAQKMRCEPCAKVRAAATQKAWRESPEGSVIAKAYRKRWYRENRASQKARHAEWLKTPRGRELVIAQRKRFYTAHPEKMAEYAARKYAKHRERYLAERRALYAANPERFKEYARTARAKIKAKSAARMPAPGEAFNARLYENQLYAAVMDAIPRGFEEFKRKDIASDVFVMIIVGQATLETIPAAVKKATRDYNRMFDRYKTVSLDAPIYAGSNRTIGDNLTYFEGTSAGLF